MFFENFSAAQAYALLNNLPMWDTRRLIDRYYVGHLSVEMEDDPSAGDWEEIFPDETISAISEKMDISYDTLAKAVREGRISARKSGATWLTTRAAVEYALKTGKINPR